MNTGPMNGQLCSAVVDELQGFISDKLPAIVGYKPTPAEITFCLYQLAWTYHYGCDVAIQENKKS